MEFSFKACKFTATSHENRSKWNVFCRSTSKRGPKAQSKLSRVLERTRLSRALRRDSRYRFPFSPFIHFSFRHKKKNVFSATTREIIGHHLCPSLRPKDEVVGVVLKWKGEIFRRAAYPTTCVHNASCSSSPSLFFYKLRVNLQNLLSKSIGFFAKLISSRDLHAV